MRHVLVALSWQIGDVDQALFDPFLVGPSGGQRGLNLLVLNNATGLHVHQEHTPRLYARALHNVLRRDIQDTSFGGHHHQALVGHPDAPRAQTIAIQGGTDDLAVGKADGSGAVPRLHQAGVVLVERANLRAEVVVVLPGLWNHHHDRVREAATTEMQ